MTSIGGAGGVPMPLPSGGEGDVPSVELTGESGARFSSFVRGGSASDSAPRTLPPKDAVAAGLGIAMGMLRGGPIARPGFGPATGAESPAGGAGGGAGGGPSLGMPRHMGSGAFPFAHHMQGGAFVRPGSGAMPVPLPGAPAPAATLPSEGTLLPPASGTISAVLVGAAPTGAPVPSTPSPSSPAPAPSLPAGGAAQNPTLAMAQAAGLPPGALAALALAPRTPGVPLAPGAPPAGFVAPPPSSSATGAAGVPLLPPRPPAMGAGGGAGWAGSASGPLLTTEAAGTSILAALAAPEGALAAAPDAALHPSAEAAPHASADAPAETEGGALLAAPPSEEAAEQSPRAGWAAPEGAARPATQPRGPSPEAAHLLAALTSQGMAEDPAAAAKALLAAGPTVAGEALAALAQEGPLERMLVASLIGELPPEAQSALIDHLEQALPPEERAAVLASLGVVDDGGEVPEGAGAGEAVGSGEGAGTGEGVEGGAGAAVAVAGGEAEGAGEGAGAGEGVAEGTGVEEGIEGAEGKALGKKAEVLGKEGAAAARGPEGRGAAAGKGGAEAAGDGGAASDAKQLEGAGAGRGAAGASGATAAVRAGEARAAALSPEAAEVRKVLHDALALRSAGGGGGDAAAAAVGAALGGLARLLKGGPEDACSVVDDVFDPKAAYVLAQHEMRDHGGGAADEGPNEEALALMEAMRSLDFAGLKAVALERAAGSIGELREKAEKGDEAAADELSRARTQAALLLASDPVGVARFARASPETFPRAAARSVMGELLRAGEEAVEDALVASLALLLRPLTVGSAAHKAFAAGLWCGAGAVAARRIAEEEAISRGVVVSEAPALALAEAAAAGISLARALGPTASGTAERDEALRTLDAEREALVSARAAASTGESTLGEGAGEPRRLLPALRAALSSAFAANDPEGADGLEGELLEGFKAAGG